MWYWLLFLSVIAILISPFEEVFIVSRWFMFCVVLVYLAGKVSIQMVAYNKVIGLMNILVNGGFATSLFFLTQPEFFILKLVVTGGYFCNFLALVANGGRMPVEKSILEQYDVQLSYNNPTHCNTDSSTKLRFINDRFVFPSITKNEAISLGDIILQCGILLSAIQIYIF